MRSEEYTRKIRSLVAEGIEALRTAGTLMRENGDDVRAMDLDEAIGYAEASIEEV